MNAQGLAMAADSAVTIARGDAQDSKIFTSANKIFALSKYQPIAIMIYGNAALLDVPWETIIKSYRKQLGSTSFEHVEDYASHFAEYAGGSEWLFPPSVQEAYVRDYVGGIFAAIKDDVEDTVRQRIEANGSIDETAVTAVISSSVDNIWQRVENQPVLPLARGDREERVRKLYARVIRALMRDVFESAPIAPEDRRRLDELGVLLLTRTPPWQLEHLTGVVVAGFGSNDLFPSYRELIVDGVAAGELVAWDGSHSAIDRAGSTASVRAFAQTEMVARFMEGVDPNYELMLEMSVARILNGYTEAMLKKLPRDGTAALRKELAEAQAEMVSTLSDELATHRDRAYVDGVISAVRVLPLGELAHMAESLVNLTSFKRRVSMETESVAGPIDVAVISRGDGFIWIKRKHYFDLDRNMHFQANYYREG